MSASSIRKKTNKCDSKAKCKLNRSYINLNESKKLLENFQQDKF